MNKRHFTDLIPAKVGFLEDISLGIKKDGYTLIECQIIYELQEAGYLKGLELTPQGHSIVKSLNDFRESLQVAVIGGKQWNRISQTSQGCCRMRN